MPNSRNKHPLQRVGLLLANERSDMLVLAAYTVVIVLLLLLVPLTTQALVNTIAAGIILQPLIVLSGLLFLGLSLAGVMQMLQLAVVEVIQQRVFANTALRIADVLCRVCAQSLRREYIPELVNRFFDVLTVQKALSKLLVDGYTATVNTVFGLAILGFYSPILLLIDLLLLVTLAGSTVLFGIGGLKNNLKESKEKYAVADWLEDIARCNNSLKIHGDRAYLEKRADDAVYRYLVQRRNAFRVILRQSGAFYIMQALVQSVALAGGGWQVLSGNLTLGQLVAAQIIIASVLASMEKLVRRAENFFDLLTGLDKVGHVTDLEVEREGGDVLEWPEDNRGAHVMIRHVQFRYLDDIPVLTGISMELAPGDRVALVGASGAGKSTLGQLLCGIEDPTHGTVEIDGVELRDLCLPSIRQHISYVGYENELFDGTIEENVLVGREHLTPQDLRWALDVAQLSDDIAAMPDGVKTHVVSSGKNLSRGQVQRLLIARALVGHPRLLILDEAFTGIDEKLTLKILDAIFDKENPWTIIDISHESQVILRTDRIYVLADGKIKEYGTPDQLASNDFSEFSNLFPELSRKLRERRPA